MAREVKASEATASRRRVVFQLVEADGITPATAEAGGQPQVSSNGGAWTDTGIGTLVSTGHGRYYADLTTGVIATVGTTIETRYANDTTAECPGDTFVVVAYDPYSAISNILSGLGAASVIITSPLSDDGAELELVRGDDYVYGERVVPIWTDTGDTWPDLTGATILLTIGNVTVTGSVVTPPGVHKAVMAEPTAAETAAMPGLSPILPKYYLDAVLASGSVYTLKIGDFRAKR